MFSGNFRAYRRCGILLLAGMLLGGIIGCGGSSDPFAAVPVSGKVTFDDGSPIPASRITVVFSAQVESIDNKTHARPAQAEVNVADGTFSDATTHKFGDGLVLGKHAVEAFTYDGEQNRVPLAIEPTEVEVSADSTVFEFKVNK